MKSEVKRRNDENIPITFDSSLLESNNIGSSTTNNNGPDVNFDNREDWINLKEVKGLLLIHHPPQHFYSVKNKEDAMIYNPQYRIGKPYRLMTRTTSKNYDTMYGKTVEIINDGEHYHPIDIIKFKKDFINF